MSSAQHPKGQKGGDQKLEDALPEFVRYRMTLWDQLESKQAAAKADRNIVITLPNGKELPGVAGVTTPLEIAKSISNTLADRTVVARVNGKLFDAWRPLTENSKLELLDFESPEGSHVFWHSSAHILGQALELSYEQAKLCIGPALPDGGFYYDVNLPQEAKVSPTDFEKIENVIGKIIDGKQPFKRLELSKEQALEMFKYNPFKVELIKGKVPDGATCSAYRCGPLIDLCKGPHVPNTGKVKAMSVTKNSSAYWLGKSENPSLQRVYGISFPDKKKLQEYKRAIEEAEKRDHRKIGPGQELFFFHELSPGSCFFLPHGARVYNKLQNLMRGEYHKRGYTEVVSPNVYNIDLWKISGHYDNYKDAMFIFKAEDQEFGMKPMNCPGHCLMFGHRLRSYRELPIRFADFGVLHRNEMSGALSGLTRVRRFQQDDAHIFCAPEQIESEISGVLDLLHHVYGIFGFRFDLQLSTRPEKFLGEIQMWDEAEKVIAKCLTVFCKKIGQKWSLNPADGAFYGPKIDIQLTDALKRKHQCATVQLDFQLPRRFDLKFKNSAGEMEHPVMIHRAILGSTERMFAVLLEHLAGRWPFWLSPRQVIVLPVSDKSMVYAREVEAAIHKAAFHVEIDDSSHTISKKVRDAQLDKWNIMLVIGEKEAADHTVTVRKRDDPLAAQETLSVPALLEILRKLEASYS